jgi:hypothetical protein
VVRRRRSSQSPSHQIQQIQHGRSYQPTLFRRGNPIPMGRQLLEPHHLHITTPDLPRMRRCEPHRQLRPDVDAEQLQPGHSGHDRVRGQCTQSSADPHPMRLDAGCCT